MTFEVVAIGFSVILTATWVTAVFGYRRLCRVKYQDRFPGRRALEANEFLDKYYGGKTADRDLILSIYRIASDYFAVPEGVLRPEDTFGGVLKPPILLPQLYGLNKAEGIARYLFVYILTKLQNKYPETRPAKFIETKVDSLGALVRMVHDAIITRQGSRQLR